MSTKHTLSPVGSNYQLSDCMIFCFVTDEVSNETEKIIFKYQLICIDSDGLEKPATKVKAFEPKAVGDFYIQGFDNVYRRFLSTPLPDDINNPTISKPNGLKKTFKLKYWEEVINLTECTENGPKVTVRGELDTVPYTVQNSVNQTWKALEKDSANIRTGQTIMHTRPSCIQICRDNKDLVYICPAEGEVVTITQFAVKPNGDNYVVQADTVTVPSIVCVGESTFSSIPPSQVGEDLKGFYVRYTNQNGAIAPDTYYHFKCCCEEHMTIFFKDPGGGFAGMFFCRTNGTNFSFTQDVGCIYNEIGTKEKQSVQTMRRRNGGNIILKKEGIERIFGEILITPGKDERRWMNAFLMSNEYYYLDCDNLGKEYLVKFILDPGTYTTYNKEGDFELQMSGIIEQPHFQNA